MGNCAHKKQNPNIDAGSKPTTADGMNKNLANTRPTKTNMIANQYTVGGKKENNETCSDFFNDKSPEIRGQLHMLPRLSLKVSQVSGSDIFEEQTTSSKLDIQSAYKFLRVIGKGSFAKVRLAENANGKQFAVKSIQKEDAKERLYLLRRELNIMKVVDHPNLVKFYETYHDRKYLHIVMEYVEGIDLQTYCNERFTSSHRFDEEEVAFIMHKLLSAVSHLHSKKILHRDLKPQNIMVNTKTLEVKILDFGLSRDISNYFPGATTKLFSFVGTPLYVAPELIQEKPYDEKCDVWSLGVLTYYMLSGGHHAFEASSIRELFIKICQGQLSFQSEDWSKISADAIGIIQKMLTVDTNKRLTSEQALLDPWFVKILRNQQEEKRKNVVKFASCIRNIISFQYSRRFKQELVRLIYNLQTQNKEVYLLKMAFESVDLIDSGYVSASQLFQATQTLKIPISLGRINALFGEINCSSKTPTSPRETQVIIPNLFNNNSKDNQSQRLGTLENHDLEKENEINKFHDFNEETELKKIEALGENRIHYTDFILAAMNLASVLDQRKTKQLFQFIDKDGDGYINLLDLEKTFAQEGRKLQPQTMQQMINEADFDKDGKISFEDFAHTTQSEVDAFLKTRTSFSHIEP